VPLVELVVACEPSADCEWSTILGDLVELDPAPELIGEFQPDRSAPCLALE